jgi:ABC-type sugar transport system permease subunit
VTFPLLRPALLVAAVLNIIYVFNSFPIVWTLNDRNPGFGHDTMITYMYKIAFKSSLRDVGLAAALGVVNVLLILLAVLVYLRSVRWQAQEAGWRWRSWTPARAARSGGRGWPARVCCWPSSSPRPTG